MSGIAAGLQKREWHKKVHTNILYHISLQKARAKRRKLQFIFGLLTEYLVSAGEAARLPHVAEAFDFCEVVCGNFFAGGLDKPTET